MNASAPMRMLKKYWQSHTHTHKHMSVNMLINIHTTTHTCTETCVSVHADWSIMYQHSHLQNHAPDGSGVFKGNIGGGDVRLGWLLWGSRRPGKDLVHNTRVWTNTKEQTMHAMSIKKELSTCGWKLSLYKKRKVLTKGSLIQLHQQTLSTSLQQNGQDVT